MSTALHKHLPEDMRVARALPGIQPERGPWLRVDEAYAGQMARRIDLLRDRPGDVLYLDPSALPAAQELQDMVLAALPGLGFTRSKAKIRCPDGRSVALDVRSNPLETLGHLVQSDFVIMERRGAQHVLTGAVLCFPASWRLAEKAGRPLTDIHIPVADYTDDVARRVQRLFDGVQAGRPLWRFNQLWYQDPELHQPRSASEPRRVGSGQANGPYYRSERQTLVRLPVSQAVVFVIHTYVLAREDVPQLCGAGAETGQTPQRRSSA
jgi:heme-dependent oxidative N-demethylase alpha subunit-like protein